MWTDFSNGWDHYIMQLILLCELDGMFQCVFDEANRVVSVSGCCSLPSHYPERQMLKHSARCVLIRSHRHCITYSAYRRGEVMPKSGFMRKALIHFPPLKEKKKNPAPILRPRTILTTTPLNTRLKCHQFYRRDLHAAMHFMAPPCTECLNSCRNGLQNEQCVFVRETKWPPCTYCCRHIQQAALFLSVPDVFSMCAGKTNTAAL